MDERELLRIEEEYPDHFQVALNCFESLVPGPDHPEAWLREFCKRLEAGSPPALAAQSIALSWTASLDFEARYPNRGAPPLVTGRRLPQRRRRLGDVRGYRKEDLIHVLGSPTSTAAVPGGETLRLDSGEWYSFTLIFDDRGYCGGVVDQRDAWG